MDIRLIYFWILTFDEKAGLFFFVYITVFPEFDILVPLFELFLVLEGRGSDRVFHHS